MFPSRSLPVGRHSGTPAQPGVLALTAEKIIDYRTAHGAFRSVDELDEVPGIGPARVEQLRGLVVP
jgi:competence protein ComEA